MRISGADFKKLSGKLNPPPDKSITHRALIVGSISKKGFKIKNPLLSKDTLSTMDCLRKLGKVIKIDGNEISIEPGELIEPREILYCGNSGTTARLLPGILSGYDFLSILDGDPSLKNRPMRRIVEPLRRMGAKIYARDKDSFLPLVVRGGNLKGINFDLSIPSAQVKSAVILSSLFAEGETVIREPIKSRDHLERMLNFLGVSLEIEKEMIRIKGKMKVDGGEIVVPGDISSASFFIGAGVIIKNSHIFIKNVGLNPTRTGILKILKKMGAKIEILEVRSKCNEEVGELEVKYSNLKGIEIDEKEIPSIIDEIPIISLIATQAEGITKIRGAKELRYKESDRIKAISESLRKMGAKIEELEDGIIVEGPTQLKGAVVDSFGDHRIAMTLAIASIVAKGESYIKNFDCVDISYPEFLRDLSYLCSA
jgi:3-phosphoshikimate 1-carboxyvinyltransferase